MSTHIAAKNLSTRQIQLQKRIRFWLAAFVIGLVLSGLTAFPLPQEVSLLARMLGARDGSSPDEYSGLTWWIVTVRNALLETDAKYPFLAYGYDWLAFAHLVIALAFIGPWRDPVKNIWVVEWAMLCCIAIIPLALICGPIRGIPFGWQLLDCSFGIVGIVPLYLVRKDIRELEKLP
jgi:hypothetical protein